MRAISAFTHIIHKPSRIHQPVQLSVFKLESRKTPFPPAFSITGGKIEDTVTQLPCHSHALSEVSDSPTLLPFQQGHKFENVTTTSRSHLQHRWSLIRPSSIFPHPPLVTRPSTAHMLQRPSSTSTSISPVSPSPPSRFPPSILPPTPFVQHTHPLTHSV